MTSSIETRSFDNPSIFSRSESYLSNDTQWTASESPSKLNVIEERPDSHDCPKPSKRTGRPPIDWTPARLRKLVRLYLLTDLEVNGIIQRLRTEDFQPCKRHVQEKLNLLLQPQPNKIRPKGDTRALRKILFECRHLQKTRRQRKRRRRIQLEQQHHLQPEDAALDQTLPDMGWDNSPMVDCSSQSNLACTPSVPSLAFDVLEFGGGPTGLTPSGLKEPFQLLPMGLNENHNSAPDTDFGYPDKHLIPINSDYSAPCLDWHLEDFGIQPAQQHSATVDNEFVQSAYYLEGLVDSYDEVDSASAFPDFGFDSDFGPKPLHPTSKPHSKPASPSPVYEASPSAQFDTHLPCSEDLQFYSPPISLVDLTLPPSKRLKVNSFQMRDSFDGGEYLQFEADPCQYFDTADITTLAVESAQLVIPKCSNESRALSTHSVRSCLQDSLSSLCQDMSLVEDPSSTKSSNLDSTLSSALTKMSLNPSATFLEMQQACSESIILSEGFSSPVVLPGLFPEYCWQHITRNKLRRCTYWDEPQKCTAGLVPKKTATHRSVRADVLARIVQRIVKPSDIHEVDTFGNSTIHISATMLAPPSYLISLIEMGADINGLNNAGQTFLHLIKPEVLSHSDEFCSLLETLSRRGFNFGQNDHLGQTPLHLLIRPWIKSDVLCSIIAKLDSLPIHRNVSTTRDCFGHTVVGQMNFQESEWSADLNQAILSLSRETDHPIMDPKDLQMQKGRRGQKIANNIKEEATRNYENHPSIKTVDDLVTYEQHVDYWRTILAAKSNPWFEDSSGRNGLHCLAEASLVSSELPLPDLLSAELEYWKKTKSPGSESDREWFMKSLLSAGADPNNYDKEGNTPLMAFITHNRAAENDEDTSRVLNCLLQAGSDMRRRNRQGETALHLAVKLGRRAATKVLLTSGANVHARTISGLGVLELGQKHCLENKEDENLFAQIMLCISLAASFGAIPQPTILDEWGSPQWRLSISNRKEPKGFNMVKKFISKKSLGERERV